MAGERERACIPKEIKYVEEKTKSTGDGSRVSERASEQTDPQKTKHAEEEKKKGTGDGERASQRATEREETEKERISKRARKPVEMDVF
jgi:hypothetical protein